MRKYILTAAAVSALFFAGCQNPFDPPDAGNATGSGYGGRYRHGER